LPFVVFFSNIWAANIFQHLGTGTCFRKSNLNITPFLVLLIHVLAAIVWLGGMFFISLVLVPSLRKLEPPIKRTEILSATARRFSLVSWIAILVLLVTGVINSVNRGITIHLISSGKLFSSHFGMILTFKVFLVLVMILISAVHDFILGPKLIKLTEIDRPGPDSMKSLAKKRKLVSWLARINAFIGIIVVACAVMLG
jgi:copper resistance protein D